MHTKETEKGPQMIPKAVRKAKAADSVAFVLCGSNFSTTLMERKTMRVGIYDLKDPNSKGLAVQQAYEKVPAHNGIPSVRLRVEQPDFWEQVGGLSLFETVESDDDPSRCRALAEGEVQNLPRLQR